MNTITTADENTFISSISSTVGGQADYNMPDGKGILLVEASEEVIESLKNNNKFEFIE